MSKCDFCKADFSRYQAQDTFELEFLNEYLVYRNLSKCLCGSCAIKGIKRAELDIYYEECDSCGKRFDLMLDIIKFSKLPFLPEGYELRDFWEPSILCYDCARIFLENDFDFLQF